MDKVLLLVGNDEHAGETYQLLIGLKYISITYDGVTNRDEFYEGISKEFANQIAEVNHPYVLGIFNGLKIDESTGKNERIPKIDNSLVSKFSEKVSSKVRNILAPNVSKNSQDFYNN